MALATLKYYSEALGMQTEVYVILPQKSTAGEIGVDNGGKKEAYKTLFLLHGLSDDHTIWLRRTSIERYAAAYGLCVVMPGAQRSYYCDMKYGLRYYTAIAKELPNVIAEYFPVSDKREDHFVAGLSMGGYGAVKMALRESGYFAAGAGLSSAADMRLRLDRPMMAPIFGEPPVLPEDDDLFALAEQHQADAQKPRIYLGVGTEDGLYGESVRLRDHLKKTGYDVTYRESHGNHNWEFWDEYIRYVLAWLMEK